MNLNKFKDWLDTNHETERTKEVYFTNTKRCCDWLDTENITQEGLDKYIKHLSDRGLTANTINQVIYSIQAYKECFELDLKMPKARPIEDKIYPYWTEDYFLKQIYPKITIIFKGYEKVQLLLLVMFYTGMRPKEIVNLKTDDINFETKKITVRQSKRKKDRTIPILSKKLYDQLSVYLKHVRGEKVFGYNNAQPIDYVFNKIKEGFNLKEDIVPYTMRRSFARYAQKRGFKLEVIKFMMGHKSITTTVKYLQIDEDMMMENLKEIGGAW